MNRKVMIVDDDKEFLDELEDILKQSGYDMVAVNNAESAIEIASQAKPDVILLDLKMPNKSGFQIASELKYVSGLQSVPVIAMTAFLKDVYVPLLDICGIKTYLKKPFNPLDVIAQIESVLSDNQ